VTGPGVWCEGECQRLKGECVDSRSSKGPSEIVQLLRQRQSVAEDKRLGKAPRFPQPESSMPKARRGRSRRLSSVLSVIRYIKKVEIPSRVPLCAISITSRLSPVLDRVQGPLVSFRHPNGCFWNVAIQKQKSAERLGVVRVAAFLLTAGCYRKFTSRFSCFRRVVLIVRPLKDRKNGQ